MTKENAIKALKLRIAALEPIRDYDQYKSWRNTTASTIEHLYSTKDPIVRLNQIKAFEGYSGYGNYRIPNAILEAKEFLENLINNIELLGLQKNNGLEIEKGVNVNVIQTNEQNQSTQVTINLEFILNAVKEELRGSEVEELKEILATDEEPKVKKKKFMDKIKSFGSDVASNILANILTNQEVYTQLGGML